ncbi:MAG: tRNA (adenosine(37)-N6)-dimethylallyltransferase MiaA [Candidatus Saccharimonadales bacterium]
MAPVIVITGPTASGKSGLAMELAERFNGEIICADSRTLYKGMDIGTAKPTQGDQSRVLHHLLDVVEPGERYTAADFQSEALRRIEMIRKRDNVPFMVGGTGLYIDAVVREYEWPEWIKNESDRKEFESHSTEELHTMIETQHLSMPSNLRNRRHLVNTLMRGGVEGKARPLPRENVHVVAIATDKTELEKRIRSRAHEMFKQGVVDEAKRLADQYGWDSEAMSSNIYPIVRRVIHDEITVDAAIELFVRKDIQLAKRQVTWLKRHDYVRWLSLDEARSYIETTLA